MNANAIVRIIVGKCCTFLCFVSFYLQMKCIASEENDKIVVALCKCQKLCPNGDHLVIFAFCCFSLTVVPYTEMHLKELLFLRFALIGFDCWWIHSTIVSARLDHRFKADAEAVAIFPEFTELMINLIINKVKIYVIIFTSTNRNRCCKLN